ncbi:uncharacterized protein B0H18DRAFT_1024047 [Fomitopsis serialis]|uniref:uncharacterized protein n=1 Tax=Fomitopsis serialis TaxID=139415 RepID=UPI002007415F|nr:uncharacterized protein B0H18DRAFT_1024047 [Neoantrodia serialis]KAH9920457.1 hypothetical protein B0H18DRAFT_1024047 [Neoantrodia serialis]
MLLSGSRRWLTFTHRTDVANGRYSLCRVQFLTPMREPTSTYHVTTQERQSIRRGYAEVFEVNPWMHAGY